MAKIDLSKYGITGTTEVVYNPSYELLFEEETKPELEGYEKGQVSELGAVNVMTGIYTGRSPKDKYIVMDENSKDTVWWTSDEYKNDNHPATEEAWKSVKDLAIKELSNKRLFVVDAFCGANKDTRMAIRFIVEVAWQAHFVTNMFIKPTAEELENYGEADFTIFVAPGFKCIPEIDGTHSEAAIIVDYEQKQVVICGSQYSGEIKKSVFSVMNFLMPKEGVLPMHCSANMDPETHETAVFFGLSGTGKTTLSADPNRKLIGDDEHGWSDRGIFNFEGGCYAKCINLSAENEPEIYNAIKFGSLVENVVMDDETREFDFDDGSLTENTRVGYPVDYISNAQIPGVGGIPKVVIFLTADAFGVLPPISRLDENAAMYHFVTGFTSKLAGTERGITEPQPTFSTLFGEPFMPMDPSVYANMLGERIEKYNTKVYLVNTGWTGGPYGVGSRMKLKYTRAMVTAALNGTFDDVEYKHDEVFNVDIPQTCPNVPSEIMNPRDTWEDKAAYDAQAKKLAKMFQDNFTKKYPNMPKNIAEAGPKAD
mgnify:FL=1